jgi:hypothetical protein
VIPGNRRYVGCGFAVPRHLLAPRHGDLIFYGEFDGRGRKRVLVKIIGE